MGFTNTKYNDVIQSFVDTNKQILKNPLYIFNDKKPTITDYFNKDTSLSTLDEAAGIEYSASGKDSPTKLNIIEDALLFGMDKIQVNYEMDDVGVAASEIAGEAYILPNTFIPYPGDFFIVKYLKEKILFKVTEVQTDTLDNGANFYKIAYKVDAVGQKEIDNLLKYNIHDRFRMIPDTVGTNFKAIIRKTEYDQIAEMELLADTLKEYYKDLYFDRYTQTFIHRISMSRFYDPYMIEFIKRNKLMSGTERYTYVDQAMAVWDTFGIDYDRTLYRAFELKDKRKADNCLSAAYGVAVTDPMSLLSAQMETYFYLDFNFTGFKYPTAMDRIPVFSDDLINHIISGEPMDTDKYPPYYNLFIDYFKGQWEINEGHLEMVRDLTVDLDKVNLFYDIPLLIFVLESKIKDMLMVKIDPS